MIYRLTEEEQKQFDELHEKFISVPEEEEALKDKIDNEFIALMDSIEIERFNEAIKNPKKLMKSAEELINDAILYEYVFIVLPWLIDPNIPMPKEWKGDTKPIYLIEECFIEEHKHIDIWSYYHNMVVKLSEEPPKEPLILFDRSSIKKHIENNVLSRYIDALKDRPEADTLEKLIDQCCQKSIYISDDASTEADIEQLQKKRRTAAKARKIGAVVEAPKYLIIPTAPEFQYSMSFYQGKKSYLQPLSSMDNLEFKDGTLFFKSRGAKEVSEAELRDLRTDEGIESIDLISLRYYYSILFDQFEKSEAKELKDIITVGVPLLVGRKNPNEIETKAAIEKLKSYHNVMGVIKEFRNGKLRESYYQVLNFEYYDEKSNIVAFSSPYMNYVIRNIYDLSIRKENGRVKVSKNGEVLKLPTHSYLIDKSIVKERNKAAVENVCIIVALIEQAGSKEPHIKARTLIERNVQLAERLNTAKNPRTLLKTTFTKTWELLENKTRLTEVYKNIKLPLKNKEGKYDTEYMPTISTLDMVLKFPHDGKNET